MSEPTEDKPRVIAQMGEAPEGTTTIVKVWAAYMRTAEPRTAGEEKEQGPLRIFVNGRLYGPPVPSKEAAQHIVPWITEMIGEVAQQELDRIPNAEALPKIIVPGPKTIM